MSSGLLNQPNMEIDDLPIGLDSDGDVNSERDHLHLGDWGEMVAPSLKPWKEIKTLGSLFIREKHYGEFILRGHDLLKEKEAKDGTTTEIFVGKAVYVKMVEQNTDDQTVQLLLGYYGYDEWQEIRIRRSQLQVKELTKMMDYGLDVPDFKVKDVARFLSYQEKDAKRVHFHEQLGWVIRNNQRQYNHQNIVGSQVSPSSYQGDLSLVKGSFEGWKDVIHQEVLGNIPLEFALICGFSAPLVSWIAKDLDMEVLIFHAFGDSSQGKTTAARVVVSPFGRPSRKEGGIIFSWKSTLNGLIGLIVDKHGIPLAFDEASMNRLKDFTDIIYTIAEGVEKARLDKEIQQRKRRTWSGTFFSTAEHSLLQKSNENSGLIVRIQELGNVHWTKSAKHANDIQEGLLENYGQAGPMFAAFLLEKGKEVILDTWRQCSEEIYAKMATKDGLSQRIADKLALVLATAKLVNQCFDFSVDVEGITAFLLNLEQGTAEQRDLGERAHAYLKQMVIVHQTNFIQNSQYPRVECWGKIIHHPGKGTEVMFLKEAFKKLVFQGKFDDCDVVLRKLKDKKVLDHEENKHTRRRKVDPSSNKRDDVYCIMFDESMNDLMVQGSHSSPDVSKARLTEQSTHMPEEVFDIGELD
jgi:putative DNA primase/helicase